MRKKTRFTIAAIGLSFSFAAGGALAMADFLTATGETHNSLLVTELFAPSEMVVEPMARDKNLQVLDKGLLLTSSNTKSSLEWKDDCAGEFACTYLPTQTGAIYDASVLEITFTDEADGDTFTVVIEHADTMNAYVRFQDVKAGIAYVNNKQLDFTSFCNESGTYTQFSAKQVGVQFNPSTMCVFVGNAENPLSLVWDLSKEMNDGRDVNATVNPFERYSVSFSIPKFALRSGSVLLYEINGCKLNDLFVKTSGKPSVFANVEKNALVGQEYVLPTCVAYDILNDEVTTQVIVKDEKGVTVAENAQSFVPTREGEYLLAYSAINSFGKKATQEYTLTAYNAAPAYTYELDWHLNDEYTLNERVFVPQLWLSGGLNRYGKRLGSVTVEKDGVALTEFTDKESGFDFTFASVGDYTFVYEINGEETRYNVLVNGAANRFVTTGLQSQYAKNTIIDCRDFELFVNDTAVAFDFMVTFPSGKRYVNRKFQVNEAGRYALNATAKVGDKIYAFEKMFTVAEDYSNYFLPMHGATVANGKSSYTQKEGVVITTSHSGALVEYTLPVNISKYVNQRNVTYAADGAITGIKLKDTATPLIQFTVDPAALNSRAADEVYVYITDAANPDNKITINARYRNDYAAITTGASGQSLKGFMNLAATNTSVNTVIDGQSGSVESYGGTGFRVWHTFDGFPSKDMRTGESVVSLYYDNEARQLLSYPGLDGGLLDNKNHVIMDYDDSRYLKSDLPWSGFESDYVYISIAIRGLTGAEAKTCIYTIDGKRLSKNVEENAPQISVEEEMLWGLKGYSLALPKATAVDCYGNDAKICVKVYYEKNGKRFDVSAQNGRFDTNYGGTYVIVYTAIDAFGRSSEKLVRVNVADTHTDFTAEWETPSAQYTEGKILQEILLYGVENIKIEGALGAVESVCKIVHKGEEIAFDGETFLPKSAGVYQVKYLLTDGVGRIAEIAYEVEIAIPETPVAVSALPAYGGFVRGSTYVIADVYFVDYTKNEEKQKADVYINGEKFTGEEYAVEDRVEGKDEEERKETLLLQYKCGNFLLKSYEIPVITINKKVEKKFGALTKEITKLVPERYFLCDENASVEAKGTHFVLTSKAQTSQLLFAQPLQANGLSLVMDIDQEKANDLTPVNTNLRAITLRITDAADSDKSLRVEIQTDAISNKVRLCVNGEDYSAAFSGSLIGAAVELIRLRYNDGYFYDGNSDGLKLVAPSHYENGDKFEGFKGQVYLSITLQTQDETKEGSIRLYSINEQQLTSDLEKDSGTPTLIVDAEIGGIYEQGDTLTMEAASGYDVLSSIVSNSLTLTVTYVQNGETYFAKDVNGLLLNNVSARVAYQLQLNETGEYKAMYTLSDVCGNTAVKAFNFEVARHSDPVIAVQGKLPIKVKMGAAVKVPLASVQYAEENEKNLAWVVCISPSTNTYTLLREEDSAFIASELGDYVIRYCALDVYGSYTIVEYVVTCYQ